MIWPWSAQSPDDPLQACARPSSPHSRSSPPASRSAVAPRRHRPRPSIPSAPSVAGAYDCGEDGRIQVEFLGDRVRVTEADGSIVELPAAPPGQRNRFGEGVSAIVIEGREALYMRARREPWTCAR